MTYLNFGLLLWLALLAAGTVRRASRSGKGLLIVGTAGMFLWSWPPFAALFAWTLERQLPPPALPGNAEAIVVLSASVQPRFPSEPETLPGYGTYLRCHYAAWLYRHWKAVPVLATGGVVRHTDERITIADVMARSLEEDGVPRSMIWTEGAARSTYENAAFSARILRDKGIRRIVLVTEAYHMPRSAACFRKQGLEVAPAPFGSRSSRFRAQWTDFFPSVASMRENEEVLHEWAGFVWYKVSGKI